MLLTVKNLYVVLGGREVLSDVTAAFAGGTMVAVMGPSGSGKSTFLAAVAGGISLSAGHVEIENHAAVEWMLQTAPLLQHRTVIENAMLSAALRGVDRNVAALRAVRALNSVELSALVRATTHTLSGGEKQRVAIARAIASQARLVLADEPTAALDARSRDQVVLSLRRAAQSGALVLVSTHDELVARRCDAIWDMRDGSLARRYQ